MSLAKDTERNPSIDAMRQENIKPDAMRQDAIRRSWTIGHCLQCGNDFKKRTVWQKYCCEDCRKAAYELRTGKIYWKSKTLDETG